MSSGLQHVILRPALVFGKHDPTDRLYYWLYQVKMKNFLLLPENGKRIFSTTYVADLVETIILSLKSDARAETYNVISNPKTCIKQIIDLASQAIKKDGTIVNASADFLKRNDIAQWTDMPLWINGDHFTYSNQKLKKELNIEMTDFEIAIKKTIEHYNHLNWHKPKYGMTEATRQELINKLKTI